MKALLLVILSTIFVSFFSLVGIFFLAMKKNKFEKALLLMVALSAGALLGGAFLHLIPESLAEKNPSFVFSWLIVGFIIFFIIEKFLHWRHCHKGKCKIHTFAYMNLVGDGVHNFLDGVVIAASYLAGFGTGLATTIAVAFHEIPQEIGDFGVLIYGGFSRKKALMTNLLTALTSVIGGIIGFFLISKISALMNILLPIAAGGFLYIAASDLVPEIKKELTSMIISEEAKKGFSSPLFYLKLLLS